VGAVGGRGRPLEPPNADRRPGYLRCQWEVALYNFLDAEASRTTSEGGGLTINICALLDEIAGAIASGAGKAAEGGSGDNKFFEDALHYMNTELVDLPLFAGLPVSLPLMRAIVNTAPQSLKEAQSDEWKHGRGECAATLRAADQATATADEDTRADLDSRAQKAVF